MASIPGAATPSAPLPTAAARSPGPSSRTKATTGRFSADAMCSRPESLETTRSPAPAARWRRRATSARP
ncbi:conserved hypothetical protein, partial [Ricinus communis]